jgi:hypothetical protein
MCAGIPKIIRTLKYYNYVAIIIICSAHIISIIIWFIYICIICKAGRKDVIMDVFMYINHCEPLFVQDT